MTTENNYEVNNLNLLSQAPDDFLAKPNTDIDLPKVKPPADEHNVCITVDLMQNDEKLMKVLLRSLKKMCVPNHGVSDTHTVALLILLKGPNKLQRLGYCDVLTASACILRLVQASGVEATVHREYGTADEYQLVDEDLGKRPFRF